jgi:DNA-binding transcriptional LysR family regulator
MSLDGIPIFVLIATYRNITRAAKEMGISQSTASRQLQRLEEELGRKLFKKNGSGIELTQFGQTFLNEVSPPMAQLIAVTQRYTRRGETLILAGSHGPSTHLLPSLMNQFTGTHPSLRLELRTGTSVEIEELLLTSEVDLAVIANPTMSPSLQMEPYRTEKLTAFVAPGHPVARKKSIETSEFGLIQLIVRSRRNGQSRSEAQVSEFTKKGTKFKNVMRCQSTESVKAAVRNGMGIGILFQDAIKRELDEGEFIAIEFAGLDMVRQTYIAYSKKRPLSPSARAFLSLLQVSANSTLIKPARQISNRHQTVAPGQLAVEAFITSKSASKSSSPPQKTKQPAGSF